MKRIVLLALLVLITCTVTAVSQSPIGITNGFPYPVNITDTVLSPYLPPIPTGVAGNHGFVQRTEAGDLAFSDGTPAKFCGAVFQLTGSLPDSAQAIEIAGRLRKLGINLARFDANDLNYNWAQVYSLLNVTDGGRSLDSQNMKRFDWFVYQLKKNGVYVYIPMLSYRVPLTTDGMPQLIVDSMLYRGVGVCFLYPQARAANKLVARLLLTHVNPYTGTAYKDEPALAFINLVQEGSLYSYYRLNYTEYRSGQYGFSYNLSRRIDTLWANYLKSKYTDNVTLKNAWKVTPPNGGFPNVISEGSFEGNYDQYWYTYSGNGATLQGILRQGDSAPDGQLSLTLRTRNTKGAIGDAVLYTDAPMKFNTLYKLTFKAKCNTPGGRSLQMYVYQDGDAYMYGGLSKTITIPPYWSAQEVYILCPVQGSVPFRFNFSCGDADGDLSIDDMQLREFQPVDLNTDEKLETSTVARIPYRYQYTPLLSSKRVEDQMEFYMNLERDYYEDMRRYLRDTLKVSQIVTGSSSYWASGFLETPIQQSMDFREVNQGWDYAYSSNNLQHVINYSPLRATYSGVMYSYGLFALEGQPMLTTVSQPYPNRYQGEMMLFYPAYASLQGYDGISWAIYTDSRSMVTKDLQDTATNYQFQKNPVVTSLMPATSFIFRNGLISQAQRTIRIQHSVQETRILPRFEDMWGSYAFPGGMSGYGTAVSRIAVDSLDAQYFTQAGDISFETQTPGELLSDTREIHWLVNRGCLQVDAPKVQGAAGYLTNSEGIDLKKLKIELQTDNETATVLWLPTDTAKALDGLGRSFLTITSRSEPTGFKWGADSTLVAQWGTAPMLMEPVRVRLTFKTKPNVLGLRIMPLDSSGMPMKTDPFFGTKTSDGFSVVIDQKNTKAVWYSIEALDNTSGVARQENASRIEMTARPSIIGNTDDNATLNVSIPVAQQDVTVEVYDALGRRSATLYHGPMSAGVHTIGLDAGLLSTGSYMVRLRTSNGQLQSIPVKVVR